MDEHIFFNMKQYVHRYKEKTEELPHVLRSVFSLKVDNCLFFIRYLLLLNTL